MTIDRPKASQEVRNAGIRRMQRSVWVAWSDLGRGRVEKDLRHQHLAELEDQLAPPSSGTCSHKQLF